MVLDRQKFLCAMARQYLNQAGVARAAGISLETLRRALNGGRVKPATAGKIACVLCVDILDILSEV